MILYHYCPPEAFLSILSKRQFWCSALLLSNDALEGKWLTKIMAEMLAEEGVDDQNISLLVDAMDSFPDFVNMLGFCLSENSDQLSQWRGYANDGKGFAIGFSKVELERYSEKLSNTYIDGRRPKTYSLKKVIYDLSEQKELLRSSISEIKLLIEGGAFSSGLLITKPVDFDNYENETKKLRVRLLFKLLEFTPNLFVLKSPGFKEEAEWRLNSSFVRKELSLTGNERQKHAVNEFRISENRIVPYRSFSVPKGFNFITEIVLGPKNTTPTDVVLMLLEHSGFTDIKIRRSTSSYQ